MWPFGKKKENLLSEIRRITKEGREKAIKNAVKDLIESMRERAKRGMTSANAYVEEDIREEVLELIQKEGFEAELERRYIWWIHISW